MRQTRHFCEQQLVIGGTVVLSKTTSHHLVNVLRISVAHQLVLFNGDGYDYLGHITIANKAACNVEITDRIKNNNQSPIDIHLYQAVCGNDKMDLIIQKATELGVTAITPIITQHTAIKIHQDKQKKKQSHWQLVAHSALEQCGRADNVLINPIIDFASTLEHTSCCTTLLLHPYVADNWRSVKPQQHYALYIGPEGGFSEQEVQQAEQAGIMSLHCGSRVLRMETAAISAVSILQHRFGDL